MIIMIIKNRIWLYVLAATSLLFFSCNDDNRVFGPANPWIEYGSMTDKDGFTYKTIQIGTQTWMAGNLKTTKYNDGTSISLVTEATAWNSTQAPAGCWQQNNAAFKITYGLLYNWYTVNTGKLCPDGWHVPSDTEWTTLFSYTGGLDIAGGVLKEKGTLHWHSPNTGATDVYGFRALPGGTRLDNPDALFDNLFEEGSWWTSTSFSANRATCILMNDNTSAVQKLLSNKNSGMSVRCIRDY